MRVIDNRPKFLLSPENVRHSRLDLPHPRRDPHSGHKALDDHDVTLPCFIRDAYTLGLSVTEIQALTAAAAERRVRLPELTELLDRQLTVVRERMKRLHGVERRWRVVLAHWDAQTRPTGGGIPDIVEAWSNEVLSREVAPAEENLI